MQNQVTNRDFRRIFTEGENVRYTFLDRVKAAVYHIKMCLFGKRLYGEEVQRQYLETFEKYLSWKAGALKD